MKLDLHVHTALSYDSYSGMEEIVRRALSRGLGGVAITDHERFTKLEDGYEHSGGKVWMISGSEVCTEAGDIVGLFLTRALTSKRSLDLVDEIHDQGGVAVLAHPFKRRTGMYPDRLLRQLDAVEIANARWKNLDDMSHVPEVRHLLSGVKGRSAGSDAHFAFEVGRACLSVPDISTPEELKRIICAGQGSAVCSRYSPALDALSQGVKFLKRPSARQFARFAYHALRSVQLSVRSYP